MRAAKRLALPPGLADLDIKVVRKDIKNMYLRVDSETGEVRVSAPRRMSARAIREFVVAKRAWIEARRARARARSRRAPIEYRSGEGHSLWGAPYTLAVRDSQAAPGAGVRICASTAIIELRVRRDATLEQRRGVLGAWYRRQVYAAAEPLIHRWEPVMNVRVTRLFVRRMKTMWGSCNTVAGSVRLNTELARWPPQCFEYVVVHELAHLIEPSHNARFWGLMDRFLPDWRQRLDLLKRESAGHPPL